MNIDIIRDALSKFCAGRDCQDCPFNIGSSFHKNGTAEHRGCRLARDVYRIDWDEELDLLMRYLFGWNAISDDPMFGMQDAQLEQMLDNWCLHRNCRDCPLHHDGGHGDDCGICERNKYYCANQREVADRLLQYLFGKNPVFRDKKIPERFIAQITSKFLRKE